MFLGSSGGGSVPLLPALRPSRRRLTSGTFLFFSRLLVILAGTGCGTRLGGSMSRREHLLPIRHRLGLSLSSGRGRLLLRHPRSRLMEARGSGHSRISPCPAAPTDTCGCQQVLRSGSRQRVHGLELRYPSCRGAGRGLSGRDHGCVAHCGWCPQGQCWARNLARDRRALTPLADSKTVSAVSHSGKSLQSVQHTNYVRLWATHCHLRRQSHVRGDVLHVRGPLGQVIAQQVNCSGPG